MLITEAHRFAHWVEGKKAGASRFITSLGATISRGTLCGKAIEIRCFFFLLLYERARKGCVCVGIESVVYGVEEESRARRECRH